MNEEPSRVLVVVFIAMLVIALIMGLVALHAAASTDFDLQRTISRERNNKNLPSRHKKFKRMQMAVLTLGTICMVAALWSATVFYAAAQPGADPDTMGIALSAAFLGLPGACICAYQGKRLSVKCKAITMLMVNKQ